VKLKVGQTLHSQVDATTLIVVKAPEAEVTLTAGGLDMVDVKPESLSEAPAGAGTQIGKRYADDAIGVELLCSKAGTADVLLNGAALQLKDAKPLPASD
jgi:hypothetical protein